MKTDNRIVLLIADELSEELKEIEKIFPDRLFMFGIAECNIIGAAAGLARAGFIPVVYTVAAFLAFRAFEFIRCDVCINKFNVKIVGYASGVKINNFGSAHHAIEDIAVLRSLPNLNLLSPASANEVEPILTAALGCDSPVYIRLGKAFETEIFEKEISFEIGKSKTVRDGKDVTVIGTGNIISNAIEAAKTLSEKGIDCEIINLSSIKPLDKEIIIKSISKTKRVLTIEEHQITGGIGSAVAEIIAENRINCAFERMGFADKFVTEYGWHKEILEQNGLATEDVVRSIVKIIA
jgi:transketolase